MGRKAFGYGRGIKYEIPTTNPRASIPLNILAGYDTSGFSICASTPIAAHRPVVALQPGDVTHVPSENRYTNVFSGATALFHRGFSSSLIHGVHLARLNNSILVHS